MKTVQLIQTTPEELSELIAEKVKIQIEELKRDLINKEYKDEFLTRDETIKFLKINSTTLWTWTNKGKIKAYGISNRRYYKRSELIESMKRVKV